MGEEAVGGGGVLRFRFEGVAREVDCWEEGRGMGDDEEGIEVILSAVHGEVELVACRWPAVRRFVMAAS